MAISATVENSVEIRGKLLEINLKRRTCRVYLSPRGYVRCRFSSALEYLVRDLLDAEVSASGQPVSWDKAGAVTEIALEEISLWQPTTKPMTGRELVEEWTRTGLIGIWEDRTDIQDSATFARKLREEAWKRG